MGLVSAPKATVPAKISNSTDFGPSVQNFLEFLHRGMTIKHTVCGRGCHGVYMDRPRLALGGK